MATFYVLPSRHVLGQHFGDLLMTLFPGMQFAQWDWPDLAESLAGLVTGQDETYVVFREDLEEERGLKDSLMQHFGAELDDDIVEISIGAALHQVIHERWATEEKRRAA